MVARDILTTNYTNSDLGISFILQRTSSNALGLIISKQDNLVANWRYAKAWRLVKCQVNKNLVKSCREFEFKAFFASASLRSSGKEGESTRSQTKTSSTLMSAQGENQEIVSIISDI